MECEGWSKGDVLPSCLKVASHPFLEPALVEPQIGGENRLVAHQGRKFDGDSGAVGGVKVGVRVDMVGGKGEVYFVHSLGVNILNNGPSLHMQEFRRLDFSREGHRGARC